MKYCVEYAKNFRYNDIIDEVIFNYNNYKNNLLEKIKEQEWKDTQRVIVRIGYNELIEEILPLLRMCKKIHNNFTVLIDGDIKNKSLEKELKKNNISFFYGNYVKTIDEVYGLIQIGVSDIYITESLAFNLAEVSPYCKSKGVNIRIIPNIAQYTVGYKCEIPDPYKFFVRPEDIEYYEPLVDVFEFIASEDRLSVLYEIYRNHLWSGDLSQLIVGFNEPFYNTGLVPLFGERRIKCRQKCMQEKCNLCQQMKELSDKIHNYNLEVKTPKNKEWKNETGTYKEIVQLIEKAAPDSNDEIPKE